MPTSVTKITIGRLFNLGNYEHVRYELTVEVPEYKSAEIALIGMENVLEALNPNNKPLGMISVKDELAENAELERIRNMTDQEYADRYEYGGERLDRLGRGQARLSKGVALREKWEAHRAKARKLLNDLGGAAEFKDAKQDWDDWEDSF